MTGIWRTTLMWTAILAIGCAKQAGAPPPGQPGATYAQRCRVDGSALVACLVPEVDAAHNGGKVAEDCYWYKPDDWSKPGTKQIKAKANGTGRVFTFQVLSFCAAPAQVELQFKADGDPEARLDFEDGTCGSEGSAARIALDVSKGRSGPVVCQTKPYKAKEWWKKGVNRRRVFDFVVTSYGGNPLSPSVALDPEVVLEKCADN